ncbi:MAG: peptidoglycan editing factor PgeF [Paracoccaceae bacterium]|nr:peptidoglycan editing factor PgeF [Paracoccaceae bacterium]
MTLDPIRATALEDVTHGFFTRRGGVSKDIYAALNGGQGSNDDPGAIAENRARIIAHLEVEDLISVHQIHSDRAEVVTGPWPGDRPKADAMVTGQPGLGLAILTADCAPVLFADRQAGVIGAAHAGWGGALGGVLEATVEAMLGLGAARGRITAVIGPVISQRAYEVGPEYVERFLDDDPENACFFADGQGDRAMFDLPGYCLERLRAAGLGLAEWTGHCTYSDEERFFSYRRACHRGEADYGRLVAAIAL